jgi:hypothetical protein
MVKKNNSYAASYKLKVTSFEEELGNRAAQREFGILESNVLYWRTQKQLLKSAKSDNRVISWFESGKIRIFYAPRFFSGQTRKKVRKL